MYYSLISSKRSSCEKTDSMGCVQASIKDSLPYFAEEKSASSLKKKKLESPTKKNVMDGSTDLKSESAPSEMQKFLMFRQQKQLTVFIQQTGKKTERAHRKVDCAKSS
eukprot:TRINITY_DN7616_c0_g1_i1.p1 TRINITY_DN7616_c0_g1~~TRINITY_DN7616_c0_g1_i1.p1  ORF type:complete len:108 (+),score=17.95 TRINITY_DN7616_c0_g1_i1:170-493(+)